MGFRVVRKILKPHYLVFSLFGPSKADARKAPRASRCLGTRILS